MAETGELLQIFSSDDTNQGKYFPLLSEPVNLRTGNYDLSTYSSRFVALCLLSEASREGSAQDDPAGEVFAEIWSLSVLMIQDTADYPWLVCHPYELESLGSAVDPVIYGVWQVLRRLCGVALEYVDRKTQPRPFMELARPHLDENEGR